MQLDETGRKLHRRLKWRGHTLELLLWRKLRSISNYDVLEGEITALVNVEMPRLSYFSRLVGAVTYGCGLTVQRRMADALLAILRHFSIAYCPPI